MTQARGASQVDARETAVAVLDRFRVRTRGLLEPLDHDDIHVQHDGLMSPLVWDFGHVANFEEMWLLRAVAGRAPHDPKLDRLYDPVEHPRAVRGGLVLPDLREASAYADLVRREAVEVIRSTPLDPDRPLLRDAYVYSMVAQHEAQHQETVLQALDLRSDLRPYPLLAAAPHVSPGARTVDDTDRVVIPGGSATVGTDDPTQAYDNERPAHPVDVPAFAIERFPVTARRYAAFVADGGYRREEWWSSEGWTWNREAGHEAPQGWIPDGAGGWLLRRFGHLGPLDPATPVQHVSYWEAEAFATWAGGRLPTEFEWEKAARWDPVTGVSLPYPWGYEAPTPDRANLDGRCFGTVAVGAFPRGASPTGVEQMLGDVYEWTSSDFQGYPGYESFPYPEYSEVFFGDEYKVLRGASWATAVATARATFRNWDYPQRRQIFSGIRVAYDVAPSGAVLSGGVR